jgi:hypothetical protein
MWPGKPIYQPVCESATQPLVEWKLLQNLGVVAGPSFISLEFLPIQNISSQSSSIGPYIWSQPSI